MNTQNSKTSKKILIISHQADITLIKEAIHNHCLQPGVHEDVEVEIMAMDSIPTEKDDLRRLATELVSMSRAEVRQALEIQNVHAKYIEPENLSVLNDYKRQSQPWRDRPKHKR